MALHLSQDPSGGDIAVMKIIGLVGGIASGKSAVAAALARRGAAIFDADKIGHEVINLREVRDELVARWGAGVLGADGRVDRGAVAERVFGDAPEALAERRFLEEALHGRIRQQIEAQARQLPDDGVPAVVIDAPLLVEAGWNDICDAVLCVDVPREMRLARAMANRGWTAEEFTRREAAQLPIEEKRPWCTHAVDNSGSLAELDAQLARFWAEVVDG
ncbi:MAG: dephospho-CoA kinase [Pirellulales bacterium]|nr:dephospho-CoA kinase [Pirellulales bacterium]